MTDTVVEEVMDPEAKEVKALKLRNLLTGKMSDYPVSAMFLGIGHIPNASMFRGVLESDADGYLMVRDYVHTGVPGVYACGDVADRRYRQAVTAAGTGCMAAIEVERYLEAEGH
jgi:thioredoxin reductase (NADPH)